MQYAESLPELSVGAHNHFLNVAAYTGIIGVFLLISFYYIIFRGLFNLKNEINERYMRSLVIGLMGGYVGYIINSMFHNGGPFLGDTIVWYIVGITMFLFNKSVVKSQGATDGGKYAQSLSNNERL